MASHAGKSGDSSRWLPILFWVVVPIIVAVIGYFAVIQGARIQAGGGNPTPPPGTATGVPAPAAPTGTAITVDAESARAGEAVALTGTGFRPDEQVAISIEAGSTVRDAVDAHADSRGAFTTTMVIPRDLDQGDVTIRAIGQDSGIEARTTLRLT